ncbi:MAG: hypothetical protein QOH84_1059, partial [Kribbellaceae bacterium]|nr:hypothetical protein [Kribbellaceae bacterium]
VIRTPVVEDDVDAADKEGAKV